MRSVENSAQNVHLWFFNPYQNWKKNVQHRKLIQILHFKHRKTYEERIGSSC